MPRNNCTIGWLPVLLKKKSLLSLQFVFLQHSNVDFYYNFQWLRKFWTLNAFRERKKKACGHSLCWALWGFCSIRDLLQYAQCFKISFEKSSSPPPTYKKNSDFFFPAGWHLRTYVKMSIIAPSSSLKDWIQHLHFNISL